ncbi:efflux RND transporter periplasmic adaptor subunit [Rhodoferax sp.]|uniref:efflux RND transporter periplasmic adaptor subunit n=1 Tax=Rhodoferax sp. TaxID=50421 RepID=UPI00272F4F7F|nr:efflux RND transporter periplasmic adaptor subunit [Rhodoferax sp.]MDP2441970.1 efflux RND transporter periplasmic adaptor subunit [Rhodoferax sp.]MDZ4207516.1 efflux RND transporter periplasmic adaptor subunit [Rhodoferax sp.]
MKPWIKWTLAGLAVAVLVGGTLRTLSARQARQAALEAQQVAQKSQVSVALAASDLVQVKTLELQQTVLISGPIKAVHTALVKARIPGELQDLTVREGDSVRAGQVLARIDPTESEARLRQARQQAAAAKAQVAMAQRTFDNNQALVAQGFISSTALASSQASLDAAQASYQAAQSGADLAAKALDDTVLRAPIAGQISQRLAQPGERVPVDARIVEIVDNRQLELEASLNAADSLQVKVGQSAQLTLDGTHQVIQAKVVRINPSASVGSRTVLMYLALAQDANLRHGLFAQGSLNVGAVTTLVLPLSAVRTDKPQAYVQLVNQNQVQHANVTLGVRGNLADLTMVAVSGVAEGSVVIDGAVGSLRVGTLVTSTQGPQ